MKPWLSPDHINRLAADPAQCMQPGMALPVDASLPFVPEDHTQLYYTPVYAALHREHRLRYNQLFGLRINEYIMMLEADLVERLLTPLRQLPKVAGDAALLTAIDTMITEERRHHGAGWHDHGITEPGNPDRLAPAGRQLRIQELPNAPDMRQAPRQGEQRPGRRDNRVGDDKVDAVTSKPSHQSLQGRCES